MIGNDLVWLSMIVGAGILGVTTLTNETGNDDQKAPITINQLEWSDGDILYSRTVTSAFRGFYSVDVERVTGDGSIIECSGSGYASYTPSEPQTKRFNLTDFVNDPGCTDLPRGEYFMTACVNGNAALECASLQFTLPGKEET